MKERKVAAWVLGVISLIVIFFTAVWPEIRLRQTQVISFSGCEVRFDGTIPDIYRVSQNKLGHCLCNLYRQKPDTSVGHRIIQIYQEFGNHDHDSPILRNNVDSIIKHKSEVLDTLLALD